MTAGRGSKDFFVSYSGAARAWAEWIAWVLEEAGYTVVLQAWDFRPGSNFVLEMQQAAAQAERTIAVFSPDFLASRFTAPEWAVAFARDPTGALGLLLPVRVRECEPKDLLPQIVYIDLLGLEDKNAARDRLLAGVKRERAKPAGEPAFPGSAAPPGRREIPEEPRFPGAAVAKPARFPGNVTAVAGVASGAVTQLTAQRQLDTPALLDDLANPDPLVCFPAVKALKGRSDLGEKLLDIHSSTRVVEEAVRTVFGSFPEQSAKILLTAVNHCGVTGETWHRASRAYITLW